MTIAAYNVEINYLRKTESVSIFEDDMRSQVKQPEFEVWNRLLTLFGKPSEIVI